MSHTYLLFDFGTDEEKAQQARHRLESWKQAFRLDKKLLYKVERAETEPATPAAPAEPAKPATPAKSAKATSKAASKSKQNLSAAPERSQTAAAPNGTVHLLVRLYFSGHEKLTEQRWLDRIPAEEPFKDASPHVVRQGEPQFDEIVSQFDSLE